MYTVYTVNMHTYEYCYKVTRLITYQVQCKVLSLSLYYSVALANHIITQMFEHMQ